MGEWGEMGGNGGNGGMGRNGEKWGDMVGWLVGCCRYVPALGRGPLGWRPRAAGAA